MGGGGTDDRGWLIWPPLLQPTLPSKGTFESMAESSLPIDRRTVLQILLRGPVLMILVLIAGCTATRIESAYFGPSTAIEQAIRRYYERHASEGGARCFRPYIDGFSRLSVLEDTPNQLVVETRYFFRDRAQEGGPGGGSVCAGFNERTFTLTRDQDGRPVVTNMTGEQYEPAIRTLIRRVLPG